MIAADSRFAPAAQLFAAVGHHIRLEVLVTLAEQDGELSPKDLSALLDLPLGNVAYHVRALAKDKLVRERRSRPVRGATEHFYVITARGRRTLELMPSNGASA